jgi:hypothetical protein
MSAAKTTVLLWLLPVIMACVAIAIPSCATEPAPLSRIEDRDGLRFGVSKGKRRTFFRDIATNDARWRGYGEKTFPGDVWAQADHWTDHMSQHVRYLAGKYDVSIVAILLAYDEGLHDGWRGPGNKALRTTWPPLTKRRR